MEESLSRVAVKVPVPLVMIVEGLVSSMPNNLARNLVFSASTAPSTTAKSNTVRATRESWLIRSFLMVYISLISKAGGFSFPKGKPGILGRTCPRPSIQTSGRNDLYQFSMKGNFLQKHKLWLAV